MPGTVGSSLEALRQAQEEQMTAYTPGDLSGDWEFKIVRSATAAFGREEAFRQLLAEEALAGWTMVEKFDNARVRFKRPASAKANDAYLPPGVDPYRSYFGISPAAFGLGLAGAIVAGVFGILCLVGLAVFLILQGGILR